MGNRSSKDQSEHEKSFEEGAHHFKTNKFSVIDKSISETTADIACTTAEPKSVREDLRLGCYHMPNRCVIYEADVPSSSLKRFIEPHNLQSFTTKTWLGLCQHCGI